jgi:hypothetical protein
MYFSQHETFSGGDCTSLPYRHMVVGPALGPAARIAGIHICIASLHCLLFFSGIWLT